MNKLRTTSVASMTPSGSHHARRRGRYTPAQKASAYAALKFRGRTPGRRVSAKAATKARGNQNSRLSFTETDDTPAGNKDKRVAAEADAGNRSPNAKAGLVRSGSAAVCRQGHSPSRVSWQNRSLPKADRP